MQEAQILVLLLTSVVGLALLAPRLDVPYPIVLVLGGLLIGLIPGLPAAPMSPALVLLIFLPPLLFAQAWVTPWREFVKYRRPIFMLAVGLVLFTTVAVAVTAHYLVGLPWATGFVLGAIVSPPDAVATSAVAQRFHLPRRIVAVLEGESLVNDATGLVAYKFAIAAILTGSFSLAEAAGQFVLVALAGGGIGALVAWLGGHAYRRLSADNSVLITLSLLIPYLAYLSAETLHFSGVLAAVVCGLAMGWQGPRLFKASARLEAVAIWDMLVFLLNSILFLLIGLQLREIVGNLRGYSKTDLLTYAMAVCGVVIAVRILWVFPGAYLPRWLSRKVRVNEPAPGFKNVFIVSWSGMRGVVSLAAALALPRTLPNGAPFPARDIIVFLSFAVILVTLVGQGLTLGPLIKLLKISGDESDERLERRVRHAMALAGEARLQSLIDTEPIPEQSATLMRAVYSDRVAHLADEQAHVLGWSDRLTRLVAVRRLRKEAIGAERDKLLELRERGLLPEEMLHKLEHELDLTEASL